MSQQRDGHAPSSIYEKLKGLLTVIGIIISFYPFFGFLAFFLLRKTNPKMAKLGLWISTIMSFIAFLMVLSKKR